MNAKQIEFFRAKLEALKDSVLSTPARRPSICVKTPPSSPTRPTAPPSRKSTPWSCAPATVERKLLKKVVQSLARLDSGDYGYCDETGGAHRRSAPDRPADGHLESRSPAAPRAEAEDVRGLSPPTLSPDAAWPTPSPTPKKATPSSAGSRFVSNPTTDWAEINSRQDDPEADLAKAELKAMVERKRRNDFVRKRELDMLAPHPARGPETRPACCARQRAQLLQARRWRARQRAQFEDGSGVKAKIDEIEQQMVAKAFHHAGGGRLGQDQQLLQCQHAAFGLCAAGRRCAEPEQGRDRLRQCRGVRASVGAAAARCRHHGQRHGPAV